MKPGKNKENKIIVLKLAIELVVVFLGVYLAFYMDNIRERKLTEERRIQISKALHEEIEYCLNGAVKELPLMASALQRWQNQYKAGKKPVPFYFTLESIDLPPKSMWEAALASGGLDVLKIETLKALSFYYNGLTILLERLKEHQKYTIDNVIPYADNPGHFYDPVSNELKQEYKLHMRRLNSIININAQSLVKLGKKAAASLEKNMPEQPPQTP